MASKRKVFHSIQTRKGWEVKAGGSSRSSHATQRECEAAAIGEARKAFEGGGLGQAVLHKSDGSIREERTYGRDPERTPG